MGSAATIHPTQLSISAIDDAIPPYPLQTGVTNHATVGAEIVPGTLKVYSNEACPITQHRFHPLDASRARYTGFKREMITLGAGTVRYDDARLLSCDIIFERAIAITLRDGTTICTDLFLPTGMDKVPSIVTWSPDEKLVGGPWLDDIPHRFRVPLAAVSELREI